MARWSRAGRRVLQRSLALFVVGVIKRCSASVASALWRRRLARAPRMRAASCCVATLNLCSCALSACVRRGATNTEVVSSQSLEARTTMACPSPPTILESEARGWWDNGQAYECLRLHFDASCRAGEVCRKSDLRWSRFVVDVEPLARVRRSAHAEVHALGCGLGCMIRIIAVCVPRNEGHTTRAGL